MDTSLFAVLALGALRIAPLVAFAPPFGGEALPPRMRVALLVLLTLVIVPIAGSELNGVPRGAAFAAAAVSEAVAGTVLAVVVRAAFEVAAAAGAWIDLGRGAASSQLFDPLARAATSPLDTLLRMAAVVLFVTAGGHRALIAGLLASYEAAPLGTFATDGPATGIGVIAVIAELFVASLWIAAPVIALLFLIDVGLAFVNRAAAQIQVFTLGFIVKPVCGIVLFIVVVGAAIEHISDGAFKVIAEWTTGR